MDNLLVSIPSIYLVSTCKNEAFLSSSGNRRHILASTFDAVSFPNNIILVFLEARWVPLLKL